MKTDWDKLNDLIAGSTLNGLPLEIKEIGEGAQGNQRYVLVQGWGKLDCEDIELSPKLQFKPMRWWLRGWLAGRRQEAIAGDGSHGEALTGGEAITK